MAGRLGREMTGAKRLAHVGPTVPHGISTANPYGVQPWAHVRFILLRPWGSISMQGFSRPLFDVLLGMFRAVVLLVGLGMKYAQGPALQYMCRTSNCSKDGPRSSTCPTAFSRSCNSIVQVSCPERLLRSMFKKGGWRLGIANCNISNVSNVTAGGVMSQRVLIRNIFVQQGDMFQAWLVLRLPVQAPVLVQETKKMQ